MKGIGGTIASALPAGVAWVSKTDTGDTAAGAVQAALPDHEAATAVDAEDLADLLKRHDDVLAAEQQGFNDRLATLLNTRHELPANDRRRLNALLAELVAGEHQDADHHQVESDQDQPVDPAAAEPAPEVVPEHVPAPENVRASLIVSFDHAVDGIVKSVNEDFAATNKASIMPGQDVDGQSSG